MSSEFELPDVEFLNTQEGKLVCPSIKKIGGKYGALAKIPWFPEMYSGMTISLHWSAKSSPPYDADVKARFDVVLGAVGDVEVLISPYYDYLGKVRRGAGEAYYSFVDSAGGNHTSPSSPVLLEFRNASPDGICMFPED